MQFLLLLLIAVLPKWTSPVDGYERQRAECQARVDASNEHSRQGLPQTARGVNHSREAVKERYRQINDAKQRKR